MLHAIYECSVCDQPVSFFFTQISLTLADNGDLIEVVSSSLVQ